MTSDVIFNHKYEQFEAEIAQRIANTEGPLFRTEVESLGEYYCNGLSQHYNCHCCRNFINKYGNLVTVAVDGVKNSLLWQPGVPTYFSEIVAKMREKVERNWITGVFYTDEKIWGHPVTGQWTHLHGIFNNTVESPNEKIAEKKQDHEMLWRATGEYPYKIVERAVLLLKSDTFFRSEKAVAIAEFLLQAYRKSDAITWLMVANAPPGFCHIKGGMIGTLLDGLMNSDSVEVLQRKWAEKMHPLQYQRPTAMPSEQQLDKAEEIVKKLKSGRIIS